MNKNIIVLLIGVALLWGEAVRAEKALQFVLRDLDGRRFSLEEELARGPIVLDFWATWCKPCIKALPKLEEIARDYKARGVRVFTINIDEPRNLTKIRPFIQRHKLELPVLIDKTSRVMKQFHLLGVPATLLISAEGEIAYRHQGYRPGDERKLRQKLDELLGRDE